MSPSPLLHVRHRTLSVISICTIFMAIYLLWPSRQRAASTITVNRLSDVTNASDGLCESSSRRGVGNSGKHGDNHI